MSLSGGGVFSESALFIKVSFLLIRGWGALSMESIWVGKGSLGAWIGVSTWAKEGIETISK